MTYIIIYGNKKSHLKLLVILIEGKVHGYAENIYDVWNISPSKMRAVLVTRNVQFYEIMFFRFEIS